MYDGQTWPAYDFQDTHNNNTVQLTSATSLQIYTGYLLSGSAEDMYNRTYNGCYIFTLYYFLPAPMLLARTGPGQPAPAVLCRNWPVHSAPIVDARSGPVYALLKHYQFLPKFSGVFTPLLRRIRGGNENRKNDRGHDPSQSLSFEEGEAMKSCALYSVAYARTSSFIYTYVWEE